MPHHVLAMGTVLAALGAKAASSGVDPTVFLTTSTPAPLAKGLGSSLLAVKGGKAAAAAAPTATSLLAHHTDAAGQVASSAGSSFLAAKSGASVATGKATGTAFLSKGSGGGAASTSLAKVGSGVGTAKTSLIKTTQKSCFAKKRIKVKGPKPKTGKAGGKHKVLRHGSNKSKSSSGQKAARRHHESSSASHGENSGSTAPPGDAEGTAVPGPQGGEAEVVPAPLGTTTGTPGAGGGVGGPSSHAGFIQVKNAHVSTPAAGTVTPAAHSAGGTATTAAAAAAADHAADVSAAAAPSTQGALAVDDGGVTFDEEGVSSGGGGGRRLLGGFVRGALGVDDGNESGAMATISNRLGNDLFGGILGGDSLGSRAAATALTGGAAGLGIDYSEAVPDVPDAGAVEEETMAFAALLPSFFSRLSLSKKTETKSATGKRVHRTPSVDSDASTTCLSDSGASDSFMSSSRAITARRVTRSHASGRQSYYAKFLC